MKDFTIEKDEITSDGLPLKLMIVRPVKNAKPKEQTPLVLWIHGGGYSMGFPEMMFFNRGISMVTKFGAIVVSPYYRLSKKHPYPAGLNDCYETLKYIKKNAQVLGGNDKQIVVAGESAGGGLAVAVCLLARERKDVEIAFHLPIYPMIDCFDTESSKNNTAPVWNTKKNHRAWKLYLANVDGDVPSLASPAQEQDLSNMPPAYTFVGGNDPFLCETIAYVEKLKNANVWAKVDVWEKQFHGFDMILPFSKTSKQAICSFEQNVKFAFENFFAPQTKEN